MAGSIPPSLAPPRVGMSVKAAAPRAASAPCTSDKARRCRDLRADHSAPDQAEALRSSHRGHRTAAGACRKELAALPASRRLYDEASARLARDPRQGVGAADDPAGA